MTNAEITHIDQIHPRFYDGRLDELLETGARLTADDQHSVAVLLNVFSTSATSTRNMARSLGLQPPAPLAWLPYLDELADWIGWN